MLLGYIYIYVLLLPIRKFYIILNFLEVGLDTTVKRVVKKGIFEIERGWLGVREYDAGDVLLLLGWLFLILNDFIFFGCWFGH